LYTYEEGYNSNGRSKQSTTMEYKSLFERSSITTTDARRFYHSDRYTRLYNTNYYISWPPGRSVYKYIEDYY